MDDIYCKIKLPRSNGKTLQEHSGIFIVLPILNEVENIRGLIEAIRKELCNDEYLICIIDDGSTDGTLEILHEFMADGTSDVILIQNIRTKWGCRRGAALRIGLAAGLQNTNCQYYVEMDGDFSHRPEEIKTGLSFLINDQADVVIASKFLKQSGVVNREPIRSVISRISRIVTRLLVSHQINDYSNGFRFYTKKAGEIVDGTKLRYGSPIYLTEAMAIWLKRGMRVVEFPSIYLRRNDGISKLKWLDVIKGVVGVVEISSRFHIFGFQSPPNFRIIVNVDDIQSS